MLSLKTIGKRENTTTIELRGQQVEVRGLTLADRDKIDRLFLRPLAPLGQDPRAGDAAPIGPNTADPEYRRAFAAWSGRRVLIEAAVSLDWEIADPPSPGVHHWDATADDEAMRSWAKRAAIEIAQSGLSEAELDLVLNAADRVERGVERGGESPRGN